MKRKFSPSSNTATTSESRLLQSSEIIDLTNDEEEVEEVEEGGEVKYEKLDDSGASKGVDELQPRRRRKLLETSMTMTSTTKKIWKPFYLNAIKDINDADNMHCISFSDFFTCDEDNPIEDILLMNYMMDFAWMIDQVPLLERVPVLCLHGSNVQKEPRAQHWTVAKVDLGIERYGTHHTKMILAFFRSGIRIVISTANFIPEDFFYLTQGSYIQDFPLKATAPSSASTSTLPSPTSTDYEQTLLEYFRHISALASTANHKLKALSEKMKQYDYSSAEVVLIPSVPGRHTGPNRSKWGIGKLHAWLQQEGLISHFPSDNGKDTEVADSNHSQEARLIMQYSSLGSMGKDGKYIDDLARLMLLPSSPSTSDLFSHRKEMQLLRRMVELVWPTAQTVRESLLGYESGNSLPCSFKNMYECKANQQPKLIEGFTGRLKRWEGEVSGRKYSTPHMKCYFKYNLLPPSSSASCYEEVQNVALSWFLLTSANLSQAAWGVYQTNGSQLYVKSYEMGVLYLPNHIRTIHRVFSCSPSHPLFGVENQQLQLCPCPGIKNSSDSIFYASHSAVSHEVIEDHHEEGNYNHHDYHQHWGSSVYFPIPFRVPPSSYQPDVDYPWMWDVPYQIPDRHHRKKS